MTRMIKKMWYYFLHETKSMIYFLFCVGFVCSESLVRGRTPHNTTLADSALPSVNRVQDVALLLLPLLPHAVRTRSVEIEVASLTAVGWPAASGCMMLRELRPVGAHAGAEVPLCALEDGVEIPKKEDDIAEVRDAQARVELQEVRGSQQAIRERGLAPIDRRVEDEPRVAVKILIGLRGVGTHAVRLGPIAQSEANARTVQEAQRRTSKSMNALRHEPAYRVGASYAATS